MKRLATATKAPRAPSVQARGATRSASPSAAPAGAGSTAASETQLRRRLAEVEMRLRDIDDDAKRMQMHHEQELATLEKDNKALRDRLEELRMEECMTPAEARAMQAHVHLSHGAQPSGNSPHHHHHAESKLLGATSAKYQSAKAAVEAKRQECAQAEQQLAAVRQQLAELRTRRQALKQEVFSTRASAGARIAAAQHYKVQVREQLRGLEEQVAREQERFSNMVVEAQKMRTAIDALLVNQTSNEKMYHRRYDALLDKRKEMAYLMEVCNSLCEERQRVNAELQEMKAYLAEENKQYEAAFQELSGVAEENATVQNANREKMEELRRLIAQTKAEREAMEAHNAETKAALERRRHQHRHRVGTRLNTENNGDSPSQRVNRSGEYNSRAHEVSSIHSDSSEQNFIHRPSDDAEGNNDDRSGMETSLGSGSHSSDDALDSNAQQIREFESYFQKLADVVQSDAIEDVVGFIDVAADERYRCFDEMNALKRDIAELTAQKALLTAQLRHGGTSAEAAPSVNTLNASKEAPLRESGTSGIVAAVEPASPTASLAALAEVNTIAELAVAAVAPETVAQRARRTSDLNDDGAAAPGTDGDGGVAQAAVKRAARMRQLQAELDTTRDAVTAQEAQREECAVVLSQVLAQVNEVFRGLGCSVVELRSLTGLEGVQQSTLLPCLSIVEQRTEEYLIAFARVQHQQHQLQEQERNALNVWGEKAEGAAVPSSPAASHNAARTVLRRPDLLPKTKGGTAVVVTGQQLPRSTDVTAAVPHLSVDATSAATLEELVEERPLSDAELREVVEAKRAMMRH